METSIDGNPIRGLFTPVGPAELTLKKENR